MPFDGTGFPEKHGPARGPVRDDTAATVIIIAVAFILLAVPILAGALTDIARYVQGN